MQRIPRGETFAVLNKANEVRVLLAAKSTAETVAHNLAKNTPTLAPYRVARVEVTELAP